MNPEEVLQEQIEAIQIMRYVLEENAKDLHPMQAASLRRDVESMIASIIRNWEDDELVDSMITAIRFAYIKWQWADVTFRNSKQFD